MSKEQEFLRYWLSKDEKYVFGCTELKRQYRAEEIKDQIVEVWDFSHLFRGEKLDVLMLSDIFEEEYKQKSEEK